MGYIQHVGRWVRFNVGRYMGETDMLDSIG